MPLLALWHSNREAINEFSIDQVVTSAGDGVLKDGSNCSTELRAFLSEIATAKISDYINQCLAGNQPKSGLVLQDLVNELGRRLDFVVENGRYQGVQNSIGFDGIWKSPEGQWIVAETKTTDAYRISLDTLAKYRSRLLGSGAIQDPSSILIVVGRQDTGELEAQIRGSRHAWDIRVISAEALIKMIQLKEKSDSLETSRKIRSILNPFEYTRLDKMIDVMFTTANDVEAGANSQDEAPNDSEIEVAKRSSGFTDGKLLQQKRTQILDAFSSTKQSSLVKRSRALYSNPDQTIRAACSISKRYARGSSLYWYAYHPQWDDFLKDAERSFFILGCMDRETAFAIPRGTMQKILPLLNTTIREDGSSYWHIHLIETQDAEVSVALPKAAHNLSLSKFEFDL